MADEVDDAQLRTERLIEAGILRVVASMNRNGSVFCEDCGERIPDKRRACLPEAVTCVDCQHKREVVCLHHRPGWLPEWNHLNSKTHRMTDENED
ncbi:TraR/DksA C4-type zinc finger protein [Enterobacter roggenkampii]